MFGEKKRRLSRRDFLKLAATGLAAAYVATNCGGREISPFNLTPELARVGSGLAEGDLSLIDEARFYVAGDGVAAGNILDAFIQNNVHTIATRNFLNQRSIMYKPATHNIFPSNHEDARRILKQTVTVHDIRFSYPELDDIFAMMTVDAPVLDNGSPVEGQFAKSVVAAEIEPKELWKINFQPSRLASDEASMQVSIHTADIINSVAARLKGVAWWKSENPVLQAAIVPSRYANEAKIGYDAGEDIREMVNNIDFLAKTEVADEGLYVQAYNSDGSMLMSDDNKPIQLPLGTEAEILAIHQIKEGPTLALIKSRQESLINYYPGHYQLSEDAKRTPKEPVWVNIMDIQVEKTTVNETDRIKEEAKDLPDEVKKAVMPQKATTTPYAGTPTADLLEQAVQEKLPTSTIFAPTMTNTPTITPTFTPRPTFTPSPTFSSFTNYQTPTYPPPGSYVTTETQIPSSDNLIAIALCGIPAVSAVLIGTMLYFNRDHRN